MLVRKEEDGGGGGGARVRMTEWSRAQEGLQQHARLETTHWGGPQHSYGKVVAGLAVRSAGHAVQARRQVEVLHSRAPGTNRMMRATLTTTSSSSSTTTRGHRHFDDLQLSVNPLDISWQKDKSSVARSGALVGRRPPTRSRGPSHPSPERLISPSIVANGGTKFTHKNENVDIVELKSDSDKHSVNSEDKSQDTKYKVNYPDNESEESFYDSCPEKDSIFKDESEQLEEWRRTSKIRRSLQFPRKHLSSGKPIDLPDNWGSVSRIKKELENFHNLSTSSSMNKFQNLFAPSSLEKSTIPEESDSINTKYSDDNDNILIKPSTLKTKSFISLEALNEVRGKLKNMSTDNEAQNKETDKDDGIDTEEVTSKPDDASNESSSTRVRSYVYGMEAMMNALNEKKPNYPNGSNSLESRVSKLSNTSSNRSDDWYMRRKSYGFEKVGQKTDNCLTGHDKHYIESSTDSGICQSSELVNSLSNSFISKATDTEITKKSDMSEFNKTGKRETFEDWLQKNRKSFLSNLSNGTNKYKCLQDIDHHHSSVETNGTTLDNRNGQGSSVNITVKQEGSPMFSDNRRQLFHRKLSEGTTLSVESCQTETNNVSKIENPIPFSQKRHTIAVDGIKEIRDLYETKNSYSKTFFSASNATSKTDDNSEDNSEKKNKKVEFCKTEVHFAAESGRVNIIETDNKPPSTNNFRRRRRNSGIPQIKDEDASTSKEIEKNNLPVMHFGDNLEGTKVTDTKNNIQNEISNDIVKQNFTSVTDVKSSSKISQNLYDEDMTIVQINGDLSESEHPRGILKNKPIKPRPYHLGEEREIQPENDDPDYNLWGIKLRPVKRVEDSPLWKSSVLLNNNNQQYTIDNSRKKDELSINKQTNKESTVLFSADEVNKVNKGLSLNNINKNNTEPKGYSTKVNFGNGDAIIETSFPQLETKSNFINSNKGNREISHSNMSTLKSDQSYNSLSSSKNYSFSEKKQNIECNNIVASHSPKHVKEESIDDSKLPLTFADTINTPRALMPARGSARKLKEHELSYFGIKDTKTVEIKNSKNHQETETFFQNQKFQDSPKFEKVTKNPQKEKPIETRGSEKLEHGSKYPIYENVIINKNLKPDVNNTNKPKHPGESIIEELTKAADEILLALNGYSGEESGHHNSSDDDLRYHKNRRSIKPLETISEMHCHNMKTRTLENKGVQANLKSKIKQNPVSATIKRIVTSSNSSIESICGESRNAALKNKNNTIDNGYPEKPQRKKVSSVEAIKARRLHRANSRDALLKTHGSSSEDLPEYTNIVKKKSSKRTKSGEIKRLSSNSSINTNSSSVILEETKDVNKYSLKSLSSILPEIRHKTAISTIKSVSEKHSNKDRTNSKQKSCTKDRSRRRDRLQEATISSYNRTSLHREKSRSADTSLDRDVDLTRNKIRGKDSASYHGDETLDTVNIGYNQIHRSHRNDTRENVKSSHRDQSLGKSSKSRDLSSHHRDRSEDRILSNTRVRDSSSHRTDRNRDKESLHHHPSERLHKTNTISSSAHGEIHVHKHREKHHNSPVMKEKDVKTQDKLKSRESSSHHRDRSHDRSKKSSDLKYEVAKKRKLLTVGGLLGGSPVSVPSENGGVKVIAERDKATASHSRPSPSHYRSTHTRTEHDKSLP